MIKDLIVKLMEEANDEAEHKGWCDTEMSTNKQTREDKADQVDTLTAQSEELTAQIAKLSSEITDLCRSEAAFKGVAPLSHFPRRVCRLPRRGHVAWLVQLPPSH